MIYIKSDEDRVYHITTNEGHDLIVEWMNLPEAVDYLASEGIRSIRIWAPRTKIFKAISIKRLEDQFKQHPLYEFLKNHPAIHA